MYASHRSSGSQKWLEMGLCPNIMKKGGLEKGLPGEEERSSLGRHRRAPRETDGRCAVCDGVSVICPLSDGASFLSWLRNCPRRGRYGSRLSKAFRPQSDQGSSKKASLGSVMPQMSSV